MTKVPLYLLSQLWFHHKNIDYDPIIIHKKFKEFQAAFFVTCDPLSKNRLFSQNSILLLNKLGKNTRAIYIKNLRIFQLLNYVLNKVQINKTYIPPDAPVHWK